MSAAAKPWIVAIDGPSGVGKSSVARRLAERLGIPYLDTGAMYRCIALEALRLGVDLEESEKLEQLATKIDLALGTQDHRASELLLDGEPVGAAIRAPEVSLATSTLAAHPSVRRRMVDLQRRLAASGGVVEGRDIGTVVFPQTPFKIFLDAELAERARRRLGQAGGNDNEPSQLQAVEHDLARRDRQDRDRKDSPLRCDDSYFVLDTTELSLDQVVDEIERYVAAGGARN